MTAVYALRRLQKSRALVSLCVGVGHWAMRYAAISRPLVIRNCANIPRTSKPM